MIFHDFATFLSHCPHNAHYPSRMHAPELENIISRAPEAGGTSGIDRGHDFKKVKFSWFWSHFSWFFKILLLLLSHWTPHKAHYPSRRHVPELENIISRPPEAGGMPGIDGGNDFRKVEKSWFSIHFSWFSWFSASQLGHNVELKASHIMTSMASPRRPGRPSDAPDG